MDTLHDTLSAAADYLAEGRLAEAESTLDGLADLEMPSGPRGRWIALHILTTCARASDDEAARELAKAIGHHETDVDFVFSLASQFDDLGATAYAERALHRLCEIDPLNHLPYANLAICLGRAGRLEEAVAAYTNALDRAPDFAPAYLQRAYCRQTMGELPESIDDYRAYLARETDDAEAWDAIATALSELGDADEALAAHDRARQLDPGRAAWLLNAATTARRHSRRKPLQTYAETLARLAPASWQATLAKAYLLHVDQRGQDAWSLYQKAVERADSAGDAEGLATAGHALLWVALAENRLEALETHVPHLLRREIFDDGVLAAIRVWKNQSAPDARNHQVQLQASALPEAASSHNQAHIGAAVVTSGTPEGTTIAEDGREAGVHATEFDDPNDAVYRRTYQVVAQTPREASDWAIEFERWCGGQNPEVVAVKAISGEGEALKGVYAASPAHDAAAPAKLPWEDIA